MYTQFDDKCVAMIPCLAGELIVVCLRDDLHHLMILNNRLRLIGQGASRDAGLTVGIYNIASHSKHLYSVRVALTSDSLLMIEYCLYGGYYHLYLDSHDRDRTHHRAEWMPHTYLIANTVWMIPERECDLIMLPKFRCIITHYRAALSTMLLPELQTTIFKLAIRLLRPIDYCERVTNA